LFIKKAKLFLFSVFDFTPGIFDKKIAVLIAPWEI